MNRTPGSSAARSAALALSIAAAAAAPAGASERALDSSVVRQDLGGPRVGFTYRMNAGSDDKRLVSQFGWHVEHQISAREGGPQFLTEFVPLFAGVEYGKMVPSASLAIGMRLPSGFEFGLGPSVGIERDKVEGARLKSALFFAVGRSFDVGGIQVPLNLVLTTNDHGTNASVLAGYAIRR